MATQCHVVPGVLQVKTRPGPKMLNCLSVALKFDQAKVVSIGVFLFKFFNFHTMEYITMGQSFPLVMSQLVKKVPMQREICNSLGGTNELKELYSTRRKTSKTKKKYSNEDYCKKQSPLLIFQSQYSLFLPIELCLAQLLGRRT